MRKEHSSHSEDLGVFCGGACFAIEDVVEGTQAPWYKVKLGQISGWVSSNYVNMGLAYDTETMHVAGSSKAVPIYDGTGFFARKTGEIPAYVPAWVILEKGNWYYILLPDGGISVPAQPYGVYGWVRKRDIQEAAAPEALMWKLQ